MESIGTVARLWRYPVKSMAGEMLEQAYMGFSGIFGDRCYAFRNSAARKGFPYLNANVQQQMLLYRPRFRFPERAAAPPNMAEAMAIKPGANPADPAPEDMAVDVVTPAGETLAMDDPALTERLAAGLDGENRLTLVRSNRVLADCRPVSLISNQTVRQIESEMGIPVDERRFRANIYLDMKAGTGFGEDEMVGRRLRIGTRAEVAVLERDPRCKMVSLDPETGEHDPQYLRHVTRSHEAAAGVYCAVLVEDVIKVGDSVAVLT